MWYPLPNPTVTDPAKILQQQKTLPGAQELAAEGEEIRIQPAWTRQETTWPNSGFEGLVAQLAPCNKASAQRGLTKGICGSSWRRTDKGQTLSAETNTLNTREMRGSSKKMQRGEKYGQNNRNISRYLSCKSSWCLIYKFRKIRGFWEEVAECSIYFERKQAARCWFTHQISMHPRAALQKPRNPPLSSVWNLPPVEQELHEETWGVGEGVAEFD